jgi:two-component system LytT family response regulator
MNNRAVIVSDEQEMHAAPRPVTLQSIGVKALPAVRAIDRIAVKTGGRVLILRVHEVDWIEANRDYVALHVGAKEWLVREPISALEHRLAPSGFVRIHRSTLLNADRVRELVPLSRGEFTVILFDGTELKLSRNYRGSLERLAGLGLSGA